MDLEITNDAKENKRCGSKLVRKVWEHTHNGIRINVLYGCGSRMDCRTKLYWINIDIGNEFGISYYVYETKKEYNEMFELVGKKINNAKAWMGIMKMMFKQLTPTQLLKVIFNARETGRKEGKAQCQAELKKALGISDSDYYVTC